MQMNDSDVAFFHDLYDMLKAYADKKELEEATDQLVEIFENYSYSIEDSLHSLRGYSKTLDAVIDSRYEAELDEEEPDDYTY